MNRRISNALIRQAYPGLVSCADDRMADKVIHEFKIAKSVYALEAEIGDDIVGQDMQKRWAALRKLYSRLKENEADYDPYPISVCWDSILTPIERSVWADIRQCGLPLYLQYPVGCYIADFADPVRKIVIEADGARWHDQQRDAIRDAAMAKSGWSVYRITGSECYRDCSGVENALEDGVHIEDPDRFREILRDWLFNTSEGIISAIGKFHYGLPVTLLAGAEVYAEETLRIHRG
jgi:very-short-patch-repair endonuclease